MNEPDVVVGQQIDNFRITKQIGRDGMVPVFLTRDLALEWYVMIKMMRSLWPRTK